MTAAAAARHGGGVTMTRRRRGSPMSRIAKWPARALGLDKSSLLRRCDRIEAAILAGLVMIFVIGGPLLAIVAGQRMDAADLREQRAERSWRAVPATVIGAVSGPGGWESPSLRARWTAPDGQRRTGTVLMPGAVNVGRQLRIWVSAAGRRPCRRWSAGRSSATSSSLRSPFPRAGRRADRGRRRRPPGGQPPPDHRLGAGMAGRRPPVEPAVLRPAGHRDRQVRRRKETGHDHR
jgi:hypothetical protein